MELPAHRKNSAQIRKIILRGYCGKPDIDPSYQQVRRVSQTNSVPYPGGKAKIAKHIVARVSDLAGDITEFREPCLGGGSVALAVASALPTMRNYWLNDIDVGIASIFVAALQRPDELKDLAVKFKPTVPAYQNYKQTLRATLQMPQDDREIVDLAFQKLVCHQLSYARLGEMAGGPVGGVAQKSKNNVATRWSAGRITRNIDEVYNTFSSLNVRVTNLDFAELIEDTSTRAVMYSDPPYWAQGVRCYKHSFGPEDHEELAEMLSITPHAWVLSYDDCPEIRRLYNWANITTLPINYSINKSRRSQELLISAA